MMDDFSLSDVVIRDYRSSDYPAIERLWAETGLGGAVRGDNRQIIEGSISLGGRLLVAETPVGELLATSWMTFDGRRIHLHHFGVSPAYQRRGIGRLLAIESIRFAKDKGFQIKLEVHQTNRAAIELYKNLGFQYLGDYDVYIIREVGSG
jgi:[ribosomal protein S18]-alanine N-acetyltransferase